MEIYSDDDYNPKIIRSCMVIISVITMLLQLPYIFLDSPYYSLSFSWLSVLLIVLFLTFLYTKLGIKFLNKRVFSTVVLKSYCMIILAMYILNMVMIGSKNYFDPSFYMFIILLVSFISGVLIGSIFSDKREFYNNQNIKLRDNEIELRKVDLFGFLTLKRMPFLRTPLIKLRNILYVLGALIGTGGAGVGLGIAEVLKRSDVLAPNADVHATLFFSVGMPVLFTLGVLLYSTVAYLVQWRKLLANLDKEYGGHKIIFNSKKKSYKKIKEIIAESDSNLGL
ncbi:hypothetical protein [Vibrio caribbeanicus]|uniref:hypothetical protein n=1 Tax=Vibrio caribbeanicus TaxID=701175 RepID=UPI0030DAB248